MFGYTFGELRGTPEWETMKKYIYDHLADGSFKPKIARTFPFDQTVEAYKYLESNQQIGKARLFLCGASELRRRLRRLPFCRTGTNVIAVVGVGLQRRHRVIGISQT
jgi:hypothetical protein